MPKEWDPKYPDGPPANYDPENPYKDRWGAGRNARISNRRKAIEMEKAKVCVLAHKGLNGFLASFVIGNMICVEAGAQPHQLLIKGYCALSEKAACCPLDWHRLIGSVRKESDLCYVQNPFHCRLFLNRKLES